MKRLITLNLLAAVMLLSCRKETPLKLYEGIQEVGATCQNGIMDENEDGIDCGTNACVPCLLSHNIMCSNETFADNQVYVTLGNGTTTNFASAQVTSSSTSGKLVIYAVNGTKGLRATFASATPEVFRSYECDQNPNPGSESVYLEYISGNNIYSAYSSEVNLNREGGKYTIEFCNAYMNTPSIGGYTIAQGRVIASN